LGKAETMMTISQIDDWAILRNAMNLTSVQLQASRNLFEALLRLIVRREDLLNAAERWYPPSEAIADGWPVGVVLPPTEQQQHDLYNKNEALFQGYYQTISTFAAFLNLFPKVFRNLPVSSNKQLLMRLSIDYPQLSDYFINLEEVRAYRAFLEHPSGNQTANWLTSGVNDSRKLLVVHYGSKGRTGSMPKIAIHPDSSMFSVQSDWFIIPPNFLDAENSLVKIIDTIFFDLKNKNQI
jgi:hypothetical protein